MTIAVLCDFDGTIVLVDTCVYILERFAKEDWRIYDEQFERGKLTLEECLRKQFSTVSVPETVILDEIQQVLSVRSGFAELIKFCRKTQIYLCAAYVCEGVTTQDMVGFAFGKKEFRDVWQRISERLMCSYRIKDEGGWYEVFFNSRVYPQLMNKWFGNGARNKHLSKWVWNLSEKNKRIFLNYLIHYDGHIEKATNFKTYSTVSKTLAFQIKMLSQSLGINCTLRKEKDTTKTFNGKTKTYEGGYALRLNDKRSIYLHQKNNCSYISIYRLATIPFKGLVYDIEVENNHNYAINDVVVSNSEPLGWDMIEGLYFGSRILAFDRGAAREIYRNKEQGIIAPFTNNEAQNIDIYKRAFRIFKKLKVKPEDCRQRVLDFFDFEKNSLPTYIDVLFPQKKKKS